MGNESAADHTENKVREALKKDAVNRMDHMLCDLGPVASPLCASVSSSLM